MGSTPFPAHCTGLSRTEILKAITKAAQDWTLEDTTALENAPTNAFIRGQSWPREMCQVLALQTYAAHQDSSRFKSLSLPCSLATSELLLVDRKGPSEFGSRWPFLWLGSTLGFPCVQYKRSAHTVWTCVPRIHYPRCTDSLIMPSRVQLPPPPQPENVSTAAMTQCQASVLQTLELPPGQGWIVTGGPSPSQPADWLGRSPRSTAGSSWWPPFCQLRSPPISECTDPSSPCAESGTNCLR